MQDAALALLPVLVPEPGPVLLLLVLLAHPASAAPAMAIAATAAPVICRIPSHPGSRGIFIPNERTACSPFRIPAPRVNAPVGGKKPYMALMFLNGDGMRGGRAHYTIEGVPLVGERRTAPLYRFFSVRDEFPALYPAAEGGQPILGELYDVPMGPLSALLATEPPELELSIIELQDGELSFAMLLREAEHELGIHKDITGFGGWRAYRASLGS